MGMKRPLEEGDFPDTSFRQPKQREYHGKLTLNAEEYHITTLAVQSPGKICCLVHSVFMNLWGYLYVLCIDKLFDIHEWMHGVENIALTTYVIYLFIAHLTHNVAYLIKKHGD